MRKSALWCACAAVWELQALVEVADCWNDFRFEEEQVWGEQHHQLPLSNRGAGDDSLLDVSLLLVRHDLEPMLRD
eukprot:CAMPEP_0181217930 /NCGR_PEP_ID=MMETSP1096-20121128/27416_1 /TAXON_ID=156174 ORGANISM="Chrysochromulina ericina, Strain CCMP281" /NCGR_SAMPLE_ID=MMETSP1096 /ASSEMBLY_ACC=CAM_ASM_000453 /LENGTH=74 /DNA_ID=CAMNT_0023310099 /DNA_START=1081 /DNA_END=1306 /DNA_ORIENTATION=-